MPLCKAFEIISLARRNSHFLFIPCLHSLVLVAFRVGPYMNMDFKPCQFNFFYSPNVIYVDLYSCSFSPVILYFKFIALAHANFASISVVIIYLNVLILPFKLCFHSYYSHILEYIALAMRIVLPFLLRLYT